jgi:hypothetical protein
MTGISVETKYFPSLGASSPALALQVTCLVDSYMLWIGVTEELEEKASDAILQGHLGKDWAVSMPPWKVRNSRNEGIGWHRQGNFHFCIASSDTADNGKSAVAVVELGFGPFNSKEIG